MAQSVRELRKTPLSIEPFWERAISELPTRWEKRRIKVKLAIIARENITLDTLLQPTGHTCDCQQSRNMKWPSRMQQSKHKGIVKFATVN